MRNRYIKYILGVLSIPILYFLFTLISVFSFAQKDETQKADAAIILGTAVWEDKPSPVFEERIKHGIQLYREGIVDNLIFTGGFGEGEKHSEAEVGMKYAVEKGVKLEHIFWEEKSRITDENFEFSKPIIETENFQTLLIVSNPMHMKRAMTMAKNHQINGFPSPTQTSRYRSFLPKFGFALRETYLLIGYTFKNIVS